MAGKNTLVRKIATKSVFESAIGVITSEVSLNQGDHVIFDRVNRVLALASDEAGGVDYLGIMPVTIVNGKSPNPVSTPVDASQAIFETPGPQYGDVHNCLLKPSDTVNPGDDLYLAPATGRRYVSVSGTKPIGTYEGKSAVTGTATDQPTEIPVLIGRRFPNDNLQY